MGRKERKPRESAPCVQDFGTQGTGSSPAGHGAGGAGAVGRRGRPWPRTEGAHKRSEVGRIAPKGRTGPTAPARRRQTAAWYDLRENENPQKRSSGGLFVLAVVRFLDSLRSLEMTGEVTRSLEMTGEVTRSLEMTGEVAHSLEMTGAGL